MKTKKLNLNKQVISELNTVNGGYAPTHDCGGGSDTIIPGTTVITKLTLDCVTKLTKQDSVCQCW